MTHKAGISIDDDDLWEYVESERRRPDGTIESRSATVVDLLRLGRMARETLDEASWDADRGEDECRLTQQAIRDLIREQSD